MHEPRYLPNLEFFSKEYADCHDARKRTGKRKSRFDGGSMPMCVYSRLSPRAKAVAVDVMTTNDVPDNLKANFVWPQGRILLELVEKKLASENVYVHRGNGKECFEIEKFANTRGWKFTQTSSSGQIPVWR